MDHSPPRRPSGSSSSPSSGPATSCSRASTSASGCCCPSLGRDDARAARRDPHHRPGLGRQRGVAARRRRRHVRGLPRVVRDAVLRLLPGAVPDPRRAHRARRGVRVPGQARHRRAGARRWDVAIVVGSVLPALLWGVGLREHRRAACRSTRTTSTRARFCDLLNPYALLGGLATLLLFLAHGALFLTLRTTRRRSSERARRRRARASPPRRPWSASPSSSGPSADRRATAASRRCRRSLAAPAAAALVAAVPVLAGARGAAASRATAVAIVLLFCDAVREPLPERDGLQHEPRDFDLTLADAVVVALHADGDDGGRRDPRAARARSTRRGPTGCSAHRVGAEDRRREHTRSTCCPQRPDRPRRGRRTAD